MATTGPGAVPSRPPLRRWLVAAAPWAAAAVLALLGATTRGPGPDARAIADVVASPPATPRATPAGTPGTAAASTSTPRLPVGVEFAVLAAARRTLGTAGLSSDGPAPDRWTLDLRITSVTDTGDGMAVAVVHALVLRPAGDAWGAPRLRAVAVPVRTSPTAAVLGDAWPLAAPPPPTDDPVAHPVEEPDPAVVTTLAGLGWAVDSIDAVDRVADRFLRVSLLGTPPGDDRAAHHEVWLTEHADGPAALVPPSPATEETP